MGYETIEIRKSTPNIGADIFGVDLSRPLNNQQFQEVHDALMDHLVIFFRNQKLSVEQQMDFGRRFGKLHRHPASPDLVADHPEVLIIKADEKSKYIAGEEWHSDVSCDPEPPMGSILYLTEVPPDGGRHFRSRSEYLSMASPLFTTASLSIAGDMALMTMARYFQAPNIRWCGPIR